jgi:hypothetical protein
MQTTTAVQLDAPPQREPTFEMERILMVDFTPTPAQAKELAPPVHRGGAQVEAAVAKSLSTPPPLTADGVVRMYYQLEKNHSIAAVLLAKCAHWCRIDSIPRSV